MESAALATGHSHSTLKKKGMDANSTGYADVTPTRIKLLNLGGL